MVLLGISAVFIATYSTISMKLMGQNSHHVAYIKREDINVGKAIFQWLASLDTYNKYSCLTL